MKWHSIINIVERSQTRHSLYEESRASGFKTPPSRSSDALLTTTGPEKDVFEMEEVRVSTVTIPSGTQWLPPRDRRERLVVIIGQADQLLATDCNSASPARWAWVPANSNCKVANETNQTRNLMSVEFSDENDQENFANKRIETKGI